MGKYDIMPYRSYGSGNPLADVQWFKLAAGESFTVGEPTSINTSGLLTESATNPADEDVIGIAAGDGDTVGATDLVGTYRTKLGMFTPGATPNLPVSGDMVPVWIVKGAAMKFRSRRYSTDGAGTTLVAPVQATIGQIVGLRLSGAGLWGFDSNAGTTKIARVVDVLDAAGRSISRSGATGVEIIVQFASDELTTADVALA